MSTSTRATPEAHCGDIQLLAAARRLLSGLPVKGKRTLATGIARLFARNRREVTTSVHRLRMRLDPADRVQLWMYFGLYDEDELAVVGRLLRAGDTFLDVGANVGWYTLHAARIAGANGQVHAFEPLPSNAAILEDNVRLNGFTNVIVNTRAVSDRSGELDLYLPRSSGESGWASAVATEGAERITVPSVSIDDYIDALPGPPRVAGAKLDIEGHEPAALRGMSRTLERARPWLIAEINHPMLERAGHCAAEVGSALSGLEYEAFLIERGGRLSAYDFSSGRYEVVNVLLQPRPGSRRVDTG